MGQILGLGKPPFSSNIVPESILHYWDQFSQDAWLDTTKMVFDIVKEACWTFSDKNGKSYIFSWLQINIQNLDILHYDKKVPITSKLILK